MVGLRTQENSKFLQFFKQVQGAAQEMGKVFFLDCGEGHQFEDDVIECEDLSGWLIDQDEAKVFEPFFLSEKTIPDRWADAGTFVSWEFTDGSLHISFT